MNNNAFHKLAKQIERVENTDINFTKNPKWQFLRAKQDHAYIKLAESQIAYHKSVLERYKGEDEVRFKRQCDKSREQIRFCEDFLKLFTEEAQRVLYGGIDGKKEETIQNTKL